MLHGFGLIEEPLCTAIQSGLGMDTTIECLELSPVYLADDESDMWCRAFSFLRTNKAIKLLVVGVQFGMTESSVAAFRSDIAAMLEENVSLESLTIRKERYFEINAKECIAHITAFQHNTTLKSIICQRTASLRLIDDEDKQMAVPLKKNYAFERLPDINQTFGGDVGAILRLNEAGCRYLVQD